MKGIVRFEGGMKFVGVADSGHEVVMDTVAEFGGSDTAPKPLELFLMGLGGCTGMDTVSILRKKRIAFDRFEIGIEIDHAKDHPKVFTTIRLVYRFKGTDIPRKAVEDAVRLSQEKYCSASAMLRWGAKLDYSVVIEGEAL